MSSVYLFVFSPRKYPYDLTDGQNASKDTSGSVSEAESPCIALADRQRHLLYPANWLPMAPLAQRFTPVGYSRILLLPLEALGEVEKNFGSAHR